MISYALGFTRPARYLTRSPLLGVLKSCVVYCNGLEFQASRITGEMGKGSLTISSPIPVRTSFTISHAIVHLAGLDDTLYFATEAGHVWMGTIDIEKGILQGTMISAEGLAGSEGVVLTPVRVDAGHHIAVASCETGIVRALTSSGACLFEVRVELDQIKFLGWSGNNLCVVCTQTLLTFSYETGKLEEVIRLPLNGASVLCGLVHKNMLLLGLNTRQVISLDFTGSLLTTWTKGSKYEPCFIAPGTTDEMIIIAALSNEITTQSASAKGALQRGSEFRTDGAILGMAVLEETVVCFTENTAYVSPLSCRCAESNA
ncbi:hypothetical protein GMRT_12283 [Giardia muris]|uniref:Uncharacterized protein n=1 Tax=Giardia muris TaxID=5742 RepID=A0A4Z1TDE8_GIAMU|nr:hypothetical protein GMRT_12283 [Giardia muris]|eukprot:TNJ30561.1 hypothetical protein GMRT_12283 [Giardia muris]